MREIDRLRNISRKVHLERERSLLAQTHEARGKFRSEVYDFLISSIRIVCADGGTTIVGNFKTHDSEWIPSELEKVKNKLQEEGFRVLALVYNQSELTVRYTVRIY